MRPEGHQLPAGEGVPELDGPVLAAGGNRLAVGEEGDGEDGPGMAAQRGSPAASFTHATRSRNRGAVADLAVSRPTAPSAMLALNPTMSASRARARDASA